MFKYVNQTSPPAPSQSSGIVNTNTVVDIMGAGTGGAGWASAHPGKNRGGHGPPWKF